MKGYLVRTKFLVKYILLRNKNNVDFASVDILIQMMYCHF